MSYRKLISGLLVLATVTLQAAVLATKYSPEALVDIQERVEETLGRGETPVVIFDLDDTLINTKERNLRILRDFVSKTNISVKYPVEVEAVSRITLKNIRYLLTDTLKDLGVTNEDFVKEANAFWGPNFFSNEYSAKDRPNRGAAQYVNWLWGSGATIVYLTGRDVPRMEKGTIANLLRHGFPLGGTHARLMMKPTKEEDDLVFKQRALKEIAMMGEVVGGFENEPANINAFQENFPGGIMVFLDTIHSPKPIEPNPGIFWVRDFTPSRLTCAVDQ